MGCFTRSSRTEPNSTNVLFARGSGLFEHAASPSEGLDARKACSSIPVLLAPMAGVNDIAFRQLSLELGCDITYTEMVSSKALSFANEKTRHLLDRAPNERRVAVQLFGHEPETMAREAAWIESEMGDALAIIDINMGCPARKIVKKGDGSALMTTPELAPRLCARCRPPSNIPRRSNSARGMLPMKTSRSISPAAWKMPALRRLRCTAARRRNSIRDAPIGT